MNLSILNYFKDLFFINFLFDFPKTILPGNFIGEFLRNRLAKNKIIKNVIRNGRDGIHNCRDKWSWNDDW